MDKQTAEKIIIWWDSLPRGRHSIHKAEEWIERARPLIEEAREAIAANPYQQ